MPFIDYASADISVARSIGSRGAYRDSQWACETLRELYGRHMHRQGKHLCADPMTSRSLHP
jgi:hypothetical protein